jgi:hypothetical protein
MQGISNGGGGGDYFYRNVGCGDVGKGKSIPSGIFFKEEL